MDMFESFSVGQVDFEHESEAVEGVTSMFFCSRMAWVELLQ